MAELVNPLGKIRGKVGNVIGYVGANGKNYCRSASITRKPSEEPQKRRSVAFGTVVQKKRWLTQVIRLGFPGGNKYSKGFNGFTSANAADTVVVEKIEPDKPVSRRKKAMREFRGTVDYAKLRVAAGQLELPVVQVGVDMENRKVSFIHQEILLESVDCFRDDLIYGVILCESTRVCHVEELGLRGETFAKNVDFPSRVEADGLIVYVFARCADGKDTSNSVCLWKPEV